MLFSGYLKVSGDKNRKNAKKPRGKWKFLLHTTSLRSDIIFSGVSAAAAPSVVAAEAEESKVEEVEILARASVVTESSWVCKIVFCSERLWTLHNWETVCYCVCGYMCVCGVCMWKDWNTNERDTCTLTFCWPRPTHLCSNSLIWLCNNHPHNSKKKITAILTAIKKKQDKEPNQRQLPHHAQHPLTHANTPNS